MIMSTQPDKTRETPEQVSESGQEIRIYSKGDNIEPKNGSAAEGRSVMKTVFAIVFALAVFCIAFGIFKIWNAFREFDETILHEKDTQFYSLISSEDINIETTLDAFCREAETFFARTRLAELRKEWSQSEDHDISALKAYMKSNTMTGNPVYADILMLNGDKIIISAEDVEGYSFLTEADGRGLRICTDGSGGYYMAYEVADKGGVRYEALLSLEQLYINALGGTPARGVMLIDSTSTVMLVQSGTQVIVASPMESLDDNLSQLRDYMTECQGAQVSGGSSLALSRPDGSTYTARIVVQPSSKTTNGEFAIGITADFDETLQPSRRAAERILLYGGVAVAGIIALVFLLLFTRRVNTANERDLEVLKKKNSAMEELNQNMQALAHHQRLETIGTMTASIAHDFNNLLTPIMGYSIMAAEMLPDDQTEIQDYMMEVYNASVKAKDIVQRLADLSKKGKEESYKTLDPVEIIRSSLKVTLPAKPKNVEVRGRFSSGMARIRGDATQISQLVINIVLNAYDAMREKGGVLTVSTRIEEGGVAMRFTDTGTGMDAETLARIFDPFYTTKESGKGTGLGLAIVHQICDTHGAKVYVDSEPGAGTEFRIIFPIVEAENMDKATTRVINGAEIRERLDKPDEI